MAEFVPLTTKTHGTGTGLVLRLPLGPLMTSADT